MAPVEVGKEKQETEVSRICFIESVFDLNPVTSPYYALSVVSIRWAVLTQNTNRICLVHSPYGEV